MTPERALVERARAIIGACTRKNGDFWHWRGDHRAVGFDDLAERIAAFAAEYAKEKNDGRDEELQTVHDAWSRAVIELTAARQREEEAKGEIARLARTVEDVRSRAHLAESFAEAQAKRFSAEVDRLTLAASESARTLQVEITALKEGLAYKTGEPVWRQGFRVDGERTIAVVEGLIGKADYGALRNQVTALREALAAAARNNHIEVHSVGNPHARSFDDCDRLTCSHARSVLAALPQDGA